MGAIKRNDGSQKRKVRRGKCKELGMITWAAGPMFSDVCGITPSWPIPQWPVSPFSVFSYAALAVCTILILKYFFFIHT